ncbi:MAG: hypothetical protein ACLTSZ_14845 [Lachnospiraceae bacterium]
MQFIDRLCSLFRRAADGYFACVTDRDREGKYEMLKRFVVQINGFANIAGGDAKRNLEAYSSGRFQWDGEIK